MQCVVLCMYRLEVRMKKFLAKYAPSIFGILLLKAGVPLWLLLTVLVVGYVSSAIAYGIYLIWNLPSKEEEDKKVSLTSESPEYLSKYMPQA